MRLDLLRRYVSQKTGRGKTNIRITAKGLDLLKGQKKLSRQKVKEVYNTPGALRYIPMKTRSYRIVRSKAQRKSPQDRVRPTHVKDLLARKIITRKQHWIHHVREARQFLKTHKGSVPSHKYRVVYRRIKGGLYLGRKDWRALVLRDL